MITSGEKGPSVRLNLIIQPPAGWKAEEAISGERTVEHGEPQGSVLVRLLFLVNDLSYSSVSALCRQHHTYVRKGPSVAG